MKYKTKQQYKHKTKPLQVRTRGQDAVDELLPCDLSILVFVDASEEIHDAGLLVVHPAHVLLPPHVKVKVGKLLELKMDNSGIN